MREIKFRGLSAIGEWVYGDLISDLPESTAYYKEYSQRIKWFPEHGGEANCPVKNGTVGQLTGIIDKNGKEIYEGDIVRSNYSDGTVEQIAVVECVEVTYWTWGEFGNIYCALTHHKDTEVIGNIHENSELLNGAQS
jgi:uncharacterized phage protein (TIGR01671 family)